MRFTSPLRLPLQTGGTALTTVLFSFVLIPFYWGLWPLLVVLLMARDASKRRASDIVLSRTGIDVHGGPHRGFSWTWDETKSASVETTTELFYKKGNDPAVYHRALVVDDFELARAGAEEEVASLTVVASLINEGATGAPAAAPAPNVPTCPSCGAPLQPVDADTTRCVHCGSDVSVPAAVRDAVRESADIRRDRLRMNDGVRRALTGGSASTTNGLIFACGLSAHSAVPLALIAFVEGRSPVTFLVAPLAIAVVLAGAARAIIAKRVATRGLVLGCAAILPNDPSEPPACRRCRAPLIVGDELVTTCVYCRAANVLGIDAGSAALDAGNLDDVLARHRRSLFQSWLLALGGVALLVALFFVR